MTDTIPSEQNGNDEWHFDAVEVLKATGSLASIIKAKQNQFSGVQTTEISPQELHRLYKVNNFLANAVDYLPNASIQKGWEYKIKGFEEKKNPVQEELNRILPYVNKACKQARALGWALLPVYIQDGQDWDMPVNERNIKRIDGYSVWTGGLQGDVSVHSIQDDKFLPNYGMPEYFSVDSRLVHHSRVLLFTGIERLSVSRTSGDFRDDPGSSVILRCYQEWQNFTSSNNAIAASMPAFNQKILKIKDLFNLLAREAEFKSIVASWEIAMNHLGMMLVDSDGGDYAILAHQYSGVPELLENFKNNFAGATDIMKSDLFNESPAGVTSGSYESKHKANSVHAYQISQLAPQLKKIIRYASLMNGLDPEAGELIFPTLYELDAKDEADVNLKDAQKFRTLVGNNGGSVLLPEEAAKAMAEDIEIGKAIDLTKERKPEPPNTMLGAQDPANPTDPTNLDNSLQQKQ